MPWCEGEKICTCTNILSVRLSMECSNWSAVVCASSIGSRVDVDVILAPDHWIESHWCKGGIYSVMYMWNQCWWPLDKTGTARNDDDNPLMILNVCNIESVARFNDPVPWLKLSVFWFRHLHLPVPGVLRRFKSEWWKGGVGSCVS